MLFVYIVFASIKLILEILLNTIRNCSSFPLTFFYVIYYLRKIHFSLFNCIILEVYFSGLRILLHSNYQYLNEKQKTIYFLNLIALILSLKDIYEIIQVAWRLRSNKSKFQISNKIKQIELIDNYTLPNKKEIKKGSRALEARIKSIKETHSKVNYFKTIKEIQKNKAI